MEGGQYPAFKVDAAAKGDFRRDPSTMTLRRADDEAVIDGRGVRSMALI